MRLRSSVLAIFSLCLVLNSASVLSDDLHPLNEQATSTSEDEPLLREETVQNETPFHAPNLLMFADEHEIKELKGSLEHASPCVSNCSHRLQTTLDLFMGDLPRLQDRFDKVCKGYIESVLCIEKAPCQNDTLWHTWTSGLHYMCIEQSGAFGAAMDCIDDNMADVQDECSNRCQLNERFLNMFMHSDVGNVMLNQLMKFGQDLGANMAGQAPMATALEIVTPATQPLAPLAGLQALQQQKMEQFMADPSKSLRDFNEFSGSMCKVSECILNCMRASFDEACNSTAAGALLSEMFVRPLAKSQKMYGKHLFFLSPVLSSLTPPDCAMFIKDQALKPHRINRVLDSMLKEKHGSLDLRSYEEGLVSEAAGEEALLPAERAATSASQSLLSRPYGQNLESMIEKLYENGMPKAMNDDPESGRKMIEKPTTDLMEEEPLTVIKEAEGDIAAGTACQNDISEEKQRLLQLFEDPHTVFVHLDEAVMRRTKGNSSASFRVPTHIGTLSCRIL